MQKVKLGNVEVGSGCPPYIIAEVGSNHNGDMNLCRQLIDGAAEAGANAVKFQSWTDKSLIAEEEYDRNTEYSDKKKHFGSLREMVTAYQLTADRHAQAHARCVERGIAFCSTPFSCSEVDLLDSLGVPFFKIASMDVTHLPLLRYVARKKLPVVISHWNGYAGRSGTGSGDGPRRRQRSDRTAALHLDLSAGIRDNSSAQHGNTESRFRLSRRACPATTLSVRLFHLQLSPWAPA